MNDKEKVIKKKNGAIWLYPAVFLVSVIIYVIVLKLEDAYPFGSRSFLYDDAYAQYNTMFRIMLEYIHSGSGNIMWEHGMGIDVYLNALYYIMSPFNIIAVVLGEGYVELSLVIIVVLKCSLLPVTALYFFRHTQFAAGSGQVSERLAVAVCVCCSLAWGFCGYVTAYGQNILWLDGLILMPLIALGVERINSGKTDRWYVVLLALSFVINFYFSMYVCMFVFFYYIILRRSSVRELLRNGARLALLSILSAAMAAVVLIPAFLCVIRAGNSSMVMGTAGLDTWGDIGSYVVSFFPFKEISSSGYMYNNNNYCGTAAVLLAAAALFTRPVGTRQKIKYAMVGAFLVLAANWLPLNYVLHGFTIPHGMGNRFAVILMFMLILAAYKTLIGISSVRLTGAVAAGILAAICVALSLTDGSKLQEGLCYAAFLFVAAVVTIVLVLVAKKSIKPRSALLIITAVWCAELVANAVYTLPSKSNDESLEAAISLSKWEETYESLDMTGDERKSALIGISYTPDSEVNWYSSMINGYLADAFADMGLGHYDNVECLYDGATPLTALMYNVRYVLTASLNSNGGYHMLSSEDGYYVYEADREAGFGFMAGEKLRDWTAGDDVGDNQSSFLSLGFGVDEVMKPVKWRDVKSDCRDILGWLRIYSVADSLDIEESYYLGDFVKTGIGSYVYTSGSTYPANVHLDFVADEDMNLYLYSEDTRDQVILCYVDGEIATNTTYYLSGQLVHIGKVRKGQKVRISAFGGASMGETAMKSVQLYTFDDEMFEEMADEITDEILVSDGYLGDTFTGHITAKEDGILYLAFPYSDGYTIKVDGKKADKLLLGSGNMGVELSAGEHVIELTYHTYGLLPGLVVSVIGLIAFVLLCRKKSPKMENV